MSAKRIAAVQLVANEVGADLILVSEMVTIRYISGFTGSEGALIVSADGATLLTDSRYTLQAAAEAKECSQAGMKGKLEGIVGLIKDSGCSRVAFESEEMSVAFYNQLTAALENVELIPLGDQLERLRQIKDPEEIEFIAASAALASAAFEEILPLIVPGVSERKLSMELEFAMKRRGADEKAFDFIVASGERGALPHGAASDRLLQPGELVTFDFGACLRGYNSDETVTVAIGAPQPDLLAIYNVVKTAHDLAMEAVKPGVICAGLDAIARGHITDAGYGDYFGHGLGHGVGLKVHEKPVVSGRSKDSLLAGMIITIEPGIYIPGLCGVRIEDLILVTESGYRVLSRVNKELIQC